MSAGTSSVTPPKYTLSPAATETRLALIDAAQSGSLDELKSVAELNELKPDTGAAAGEDLVTYWRRVSADRTGRDILAVIEILLSDEPQQLRTGRDAENSIVYVWPQFAGSPLDSLNIAQVAHLEALNGKDEAMRMRGAGRYDGWRLSIGADGVWHSFRRDAS